jgi:hypothetical protein
MPLPVSGIVTAPLLAALRIEPATAGLSHMAVLAIIYGPKRLAGHQFDG